MDGVCESRYRIKSDISNFFRRRTKSQTCGNQTKICRLPPSSTASNYQQIKPCTTVRRRNVPFAGGAARRRNNVEARRAAAATTAAATATVNVLLRGLRGRRRRRRPSGLIERSSGGATSPACAAPRCDAASGDRRLVWRGTGRCLAVSRPPPPRARVVPYHHDGRPVSCRACASRNHRRQIQGVIPSTAHSRLNKA